jgi:hypothetical protein
MISQISELARSLRVKGSHGGSLGNSKTIGTPYAFLQLSIPFHPEHTGETATGLPSAGLPPLP